MRPEISFVPHVLLDLDGTICAENDPLPGSAALIESFTRTRRSFAVLSNSASSPASVHERLANMGIEMPADRIFTAAAAACKYILDRFGPRPRVLDLCTESARELLVGKAVFVESADESCDAVFAGAPANVLATTARQRMALELLKRGATLVGLCADRVYPSQRGIEFGSGALNEMLGYAANVKPVYCGKPQKLFFKELCSALNMQPQDCVLVGDNLESDVAGAKAVGMRTILSMSGVTGPRDLLSLPDAARPDSIIANLTELL